MAEIFKILHSFRTLQEHQMANLCLHPIFPKGYGTHGHGSETHTLGHGTRSLVKTNLCCIVCCTCVFLRTWAFCLGALGLLGHEPLSLSLSLSLEIESGAL